MESYKDVVRTRAREFFDAHHSEFLEDDEEHGGKSETPSFFKWLDRTRKLNEVVEKAVSKWGHKEFHWVQSNTRNPAPAGGDPRSNCFGSFYNDLLHELKKLKKKI